MRVLLGCSEYDEVLVDVMTDIFMSRESVYFLWSDFISSILFSIVVSSLKLYA